MPRLKNAKWEKFAWHVANGMSKKKAAIEAGYSATAKENRTSRNLMERPEVVERIREFRGKSIETTQIGLAHVLEQLDDTAREARADGSYKAAVDAYKHIANIIEGCEARGENPGYIPTEAVPLDTEHLMRQLGEGPDGDEVSVHELQVGLSDGDGGGGMLRGGLGRGGGGAEYEPAGSPVGGGSLQEDGDPAD